MDFLPAVNRLKIVTKELETVPFSQAINWAQLELLQAVHDQMNQNLPVRIIVLKARQLGISTIISALMFTIAFMKPRLRGLVVSHENDSSEHLLSIVENYWETYWAKMLYTERYRGAKRLAWNETQSFLRVATAKNVKAGRSTTLQFLHASEVAFYDNPTTLMTGLNQAVPHTPWTFQFYESTANGIGNYFHSRWEAAEAGESEYIPLFFPWWQHPEYALPKAPKVIALDDEEKVLASFLATKHLDDGEINSRLAWRRWAIKELVDNKIEDFHQEYPSDPEEAFIATGYNVFPLPLLNKCYQPKEPTIGRLTREGERVRFAPDPTGPLRVFKEPSKDAEFGVYMAGGDPTRTTRGDYACIQVVNRRTWEQVAIWRAKSDPVTFAEEIAKVGRWYNYAMVAPEIQGPGYATIGALQQMNYPKVWKRQRADKSPGEFETRWGWESSSKTKPEMIGNLLKMVVDGNVIIHDRQTFIEMKNYVVLDNGEYGNSDEEAHDDTVTALGITMTCTLYEMAGLIAYGSESAQGAPIVGRNDTPIEVGVGADTEPSWERWGEGA